jgi:MarR family transcriptional regulator, organic hydroperoxide resistance regulator
MVQYRPRVDEALAVHRSKAPVNQKRTCSLRRPVADGAANRVVRMHKPFLEPLGLTFPQYLVILELLDGAPLSVGSLGGRLDMDTGTITQLVKRLGAVGLVTRTRDPSDQRRVMMDLTAPGRGMEAEVRGITQKIKSACQLADEGVDDLRRTLENLVHPAKDHSAAELMSTPSTTISTSLKVKPPSMSRQRAAPPNAAWLISWSSPGARKRWSTTTTT